MMIQLVNGNEQLHADGNTHNSSEEEAQASRYSFAALLGKSFSKEKVEKNK